MSAISRRIRDLEDSIGAALFIRHHRGVSLTDAGRAFIVRARRAITEIDTAKLEVGAAGRAEEGALRIGIFSSLASGFIAELLECYAQQHPGIHTKFIEGTPTGVLDTGGRRTGRAAAAALWDDIATALAKGKVETAAHGLRHHLEYVSRQLADHLGARPIFRADGNYDLGELLPNVLSRAKELYGKAADAAQSWGNTTAKEAALERKATLSGSSGASNVEQWAVNKAVHYNEWANFGKKDFEPVVTAFKELLECLRCKDCQTWLYVTPRGGSPDSLRCQCSAVSLNLKAKPK